MKAAIYCRLSKEDENRVGESESIQNQKSMLIQYAIEKGLDIYQIYCDEDYSGVDRERPGFNAMLQAASEHKFDVVLAKTQSRFTRDMELVEKYLHGKFAEWGIRFIAVVDHVDTDDKANKKSRQINGLINEWYLEDLSNNVRSVLDHKRREGQYIASFALYGYCKDSNQKGKLKIDPEAAAVVRRIYFMALDGLGVHKIAQVLNSEGILNPTEYKRMHGEHCRISQKNNSRGLWSAATVYQMLHNQTYIGDLVQGRHKKVSYKSKKTIWLPRAQWIVVPNTHEAIIDREIFEDVQRLLSVRARSGSKGTIHPLARKIMCSCCGSIMEQCGSGTTKADSRRKKYVRCRMHQRAPERCTNKTCTDLAFLQEAVRQRIQNYSENYFEPDQMVFPERNHSIAKREQELKKELHRLKCEIEKRQKAIQELYLDKTAGIIGKAQFIELNQVFLEENDRSEKQIAKLEDELKKNGSDKSTALAQRERIKELARIAELSRELVGLFLDYIIVSPKDPTTGEQRVVIAWLF